MKDLRFVTKDRKPFIGACQISQVTYNLEKPSRCSFTMLLRINIHVKSYYDSIIPHYRFSTSYTYSFAL